MSASEIHCQYYKTGPGLKFTCLAGIDIEATFKPCWPCWTANNAEGKGAKCDKFLAYTPEQIAARKREVDESIAQMFMVNTAVHDFEEANGGKLIGQTRRMDCPVCKAVGALKIDRIPTRLYVYCDTPKCVGYEANLGRGHR